MEILDGKQTARNVKDRISAEVNLLKKKPRLCVVLVGDDPASAVYVRNKNRDCEECGIKCDTYHLGEDTPESFVLDLIDSKNKDEDTTAILVQLPLPKHINEAKVINSIVPWKDADCFSPVNVGSFYIGNGLISSCTPGGIEALLDEYGIEVEGKNCVVVGRSNIVGKPMAQILLKKNGTVTICHSKTPDLAKFTREADILISAVGKVGLITSDMVKDGAVVIDVAMNRNENGKLCGDVDYENVAEKCSYITPVPGGVGPMTRAILMDNVLKLAKLASSK